MSQENRGQCAYCGELNPYTSLTCHHCYTRLPWADALTQSSAQNGTTLSGYSAGFSVDASCRAAISVAASCSASATVLLKLWFAARARRCILRRLRYAGAWCAHSGRLLCRRRNL
jgi:hypothetical protein